MPTTRIRSRRGRRRSTSGPARSRSSVGRISVDLHWHVVYKYQDRRWYSIDPDQLFARRRTVDIAGHRCATFDEVDTVFHLALHAAREGCHRLVWLKDIELAVAVGRAGSRRAGPSLGRGEVRAGDRHRPGPLEVAARDGGARRDHHRTRRTGLAAGREGGRRVRRPRLDEPVAVAGHAADEGDPDVDPAHRRPGRPADRRTSLRATVRADAATRLRSARPAPPTNGRATSSTAPTFFTLVRDWRSDARNSSPGIS